MPNSFLTSIFGSKHERDVKALSPLVDRVNEWSDKVRDMTDSKLRDMTVDFKNELAAGKTLDDILPPAFAVVREAAWRIIGERPFDVQVMGGIVLHQGRIAEMKTGEGKTLTSTMPIYLNALSGKGVHIVTVNDYLARRDREWMGPIFEFLGLSVGVIQNNMPYEGKKAAYECDLTYGTNNEFGFDYLRDNMEQDIRNKRQRGHNYTIVDEVDSVLIDEARTPLIISGPAEESTEKYYTINKIIPFLQKDKDFALDEKAHAVTPTEEGNKHIEKLLNIDNLYSSANVGLVHHVIQALRAHHLYKKDVDYIVKDDEVIIVDEFTGRLMPGRRFSEGLHQALEAKEAVRIANENQTLATVTLQNYFRMYKKLAGMTGTADTEATEFHEIYKLDVVVMPTNRPMIRGDAADRIFRTTREKMNAIVEEIQKIHEKGQPVLVGTISIDMSEQISRMLRKANVQHNVLNAKYHEKEAAIVKQAGKLAMVTIATNMAGRGTDIILGGYPDYKDQLLIHSTVETEVFNKFVQFVIQNDFGNAEAMLIEFSEDEKEEGLLLLAKKAVKNYDFDSAKRYVSQLTLKSSREKMDEILSDAEEWKKDHDKVIENGGLFILGTERHESRRIDNQLRGRSGRQGDPGASCFYISLEDDLMRLFGSERIAGVMQSLGMKEGEDIQHPWISKSIENAQKRVENRNFDIRKHLLEYDNVMNDQRTFIYKKRDQVLEGADLQDDIYDAIYDTVEAQLDKTTDTKRPLQTWDLTGLTQFLRDAYLSDTDPGQLIGVSQKKEEFIDKVFKAVLEKYKEKEVRLGRETMKDLERMIFLQVIDNHWKDHLYAMDTLKEGIGLRGYGQRDPLLEYKFEGFNYFKMMLENIKKEVTEFILKMEFAAQTGPMPGVYGSRHNIQHQEFDFFDSARQDAMARRQAEGAARPAEASRPGMPPMDRAEVAAGGPQDGPRERNQVIAGAKVGRNDPCPCGSGKKYKHCHGRNG